MNTKRNILPMLLAALLLFCLPIASLAENVPIQNVSILNTPIKGQILLEKTGQMQTTCEQGYLKGAVFEIRAAENIVGQDGTQWYSCGELVATMTTSGEGVEKSPLLPLGKYTVKEVSAPSGYVLDLTTYTVEIQALDQETPIVSATVSSINYPAEILLLKTDADGKALAGAQFVLLDADGCETASAVSDADGLVRFRFVPQGQYTICETSAPDGYLLNRSAISVTVTPNWTNAEEPIATVVNQQKKILFIKVDTAGTDFSVKFLHLRDGVAMAFRNGLSGFVPLDLLIGLLCGYALCLLVHAKRRNAKKYRHGEEYGAARWGKPSDIAPFVDPDPWNNIILTQTERLTMSSRPANPKNARNNGVFFIL